MINRILIEQMERELPVMLADTRFFTSGPARPPREGFVPLPPPSGKPEPDGFARMTRHVADSQEPKKSFAAQMIADKTADSREKAAPKTGQNVLRGKHPNRSADAQPCPYCHSENTWSKARTKSGKRRRMCKETGRGKSFLIG